MTGELAPSPPARLRAAVSEDGLHRDLGGHWGFVSCYAEVPTSLEPNSNVDYKITITSASRIAWSINTETMFSVCSASCCMRSELAPEYEEYASGNRAWEKDSSADESSPSPMRRGAPTLYAGVPAEKGFLIRRGDMMYRIMLSK